MTFFVMEQIVLIDFCLFDPRELRYVHLPGEKHLDKLEKLDLVMSAEPMISAKQLPYPQILDHFI